MKSIKRIKQYGEVFTPEPLVNDMLDKLPHEVWEKDRSLCDPSCGDGNFLVNILRRKIKLQHLPLEALQSIFGADILEDNIEICRFRLLNIVKEHETVTRDHVYTVIRNIVWVDQKYYPKGSLDYDFSFAKDIKEEDINSLLRKALDL